MDKSTEKILASYYIKSGYFPEKSDYISLKRLRDKFNSFEDEFKVYLLYEFETAFNAEKLFRLIYSDVYVDDLLKEVQNIRKLKYKAACIESEISKLSQEKEKTILEYLNKLSKLKEDIYD